MRFQVTIIWLTLWTVCIAKDCQEPPPKRDTEILLGSWNDERYTEGTRATYKCRPGFRTLGTITKICSNGEWVSLNPSRICQRKPCGHPGDTPYGSFKLTVRNEFEYGAKVVYSCSEGYQLIGAINYRECEPEGWSNHIPLCEVVKCLPVTEPENGRVISDALEPGQEYSFGQVVRFECDSRFKLDGPQEIHCSADGTWSGEMPKCVEISCSIPEILNGRAMSTKKSYKENERLQYKCNQGFEYTERGDTTCTKFGWSPSPSCKEVICNPPYIVNGDFSPARIVHRAEDEVTYQCKRGFYPATRGNRIKCTSSGWIPAPRCSLKPCDFPEIKHGSMYEAERYRPYFPVEIGKYYYYSCDPGFDTPSQSTWAYITCTKDGWSPKVPCRRKCYLYHVENGYFQNSRSYFFEGDSVNVLCNREHSLPNDQNMITCTEQGWSPSPKCIRVKTCLKSDANIQNGFISEASSKYNVNKKTPFQCKQGFVTSDGETFGYITCLESGWSSQPACIKSCGKPVFENARAKNNVTWYKLNDKLEYECSNGYENRGGNTTGSIVCGIDGWSDTPTCYERECNVPVIPQNVDAQPKKGKYKVGEVLKFTCRGKLKIVGADSIQCYHFGWSPNPPECKEKITSCDPPPQLPNGKIKGENKEEYVHSEVVEYDCNPKFLLKGSKKIQCVDGEWTTLPICVEEDKTCGDIPVLENGFTLSPERPYHHGESVKFRCRESFTMIGYKSITCARGTWTQLPQCVATEHLERCLFSKTRIFESIEPEQYEFTHNSNITYKCKHKPEHKQSTCINGRWFPEPTCTEKLKTSCPPPPQIPNAQDMTTTVNYQNGEKVSLLCQENYLIQGTDELVCQDGIWQSIPRCTEKIACLTPPHIEHGFINLATSSDNGKEPSETKYPHGTKLTYICEEGFRVSEENEIRCDMGKWSTPPQCVGLPCKPPPSIYNGVFTPELESYQHGEEVTYSCTDGFGIDGLESIKCFAGKWPPLPECISTDCPQLPTFPNTVLVSPEKESYKSGDQLKYECKQNFRLDGSNIVQCIVGKWKGNPICKDISCGYPPDVKNAVILKQMIRYPHGERVRYECERHYYLSGEEEVMCLNGTWTEPPKCQDSKGKCERPPPIENGDTVSATLDEYAQGSRVEYQCQSFYELQGDRYITCRDGQWSQPPKCLDACVISQEEMDKHNIQLKWVDKKKLYSRTGDITEFECKWGHKKKRGDIFRVKCQEGKMKYPQCILSST